MIDWQTRLSEVMDAKGISGGELARRTGFTAQYINSLRSKERGARLTLDTARRLAQGLQIPVEWLTGGVEGREWGSGAYPSYVEPPPDSVTLSERYPTRSEAVALLANKVEPEVIAALRTVVPPHPEADPGRDFWIEYAKSLRLDFQRIQSDPVLNRAPSPSPSSPSLPSSPSSPNLSGSTSSPNLPSSRPKLSANGGKARTSDPGERK